MAKIISLVELDKREKEKKKKQKEEGNKKVLNLSPEETNPFLSKENFDKAKTNLNTYTKRIGVVPGNNSYSAPNLFTIRNKQLNDSLSGKSTLLNNKISDVLNISKNEAQNVQTYQKAINTPLGKNLSNEVKRTRNEYAKAESDYKYQQGLEKYKNASNIEKVGLLLTSPLRGAADVLNLNNNRMYEDPNTKTKYKLPSYLDGVKKGIQQDANGVVKTIDAIGDQVGRVGTSAILNSILPYAGTVVYNTNLFDKSYNETLREGYTTKQATSYAVLNTATEMLTEKLLGASVGKFMEKGGFEKTISNGLKKFIKSDKINSVISSAISEGSEEFVQEFIDNAERNWVLKENNEVFSEETLKNALYSGLIGALSSGMTEGAKQLTKNACKAHKDQIIYNLERTYNNDLSETNKLKIENKVFEEYIANDGVVNPQKVIDTFLQDKNVKKQNLIDSMESNNIDLNDSKIQEVVGILNKFIDDKDYNITFDSSLKNNVNGVNINGTDIRINPNSSRAVEFITMHEITHSISNKEMVKIVNDYIKHNPDMQEKLKSLKKTYKTNDISEEVLADISGELFSDYKFIQNLKNSEPNSFKKINNVITSLANKILRGSDEELFIEDLRNKWAKAYRSSETNLNVSSKFSIQEDEQGNKFVNIDTDQDIFEGINEKDYNKIAKMYINDYLLGNTNLSNEDTVLIDNKSSRKYTNPGKKQPNFDVKMKLTPELKNVLSITNKVSESLPSKDNSKYSKWEYHDFDFKLGNQTFTGTVNIGIDNNGEKHFYEINNIKKTSGISGTSLNRPTGFKELATTGLQLPKESSSNDSNIPQFDKDVKSGVLPNTNNTQNSLNNTTWLDYLDKKFPQVDNLTYLKDHKLLNDNELKELTHLREMPFELTVDEKNRLDTLESKIANNDTESKIDTVLNIKTSEKRKSQSEYEDQAIKEKLQEKITKNRFKAIDEATEAGNRLMNFTKQEKQSFKENLDKYVGMSTSELNDTKTFRDIKAIVEKYANKELIYVDNELIEVQNAVKKYRFKPSENIVNGIKDFKDFRNNNQGKIVFNKNGHSVDTIYQELSKQHPEYFDYDINNEVDMLYRIESLMKQDTKLIDTYRIDEDSLNSATRDVIQKLQNKMMSDEDIKNLQDIIEEKALARTREVVYREYIDKMGITVDDLGTGEDINMVDLSRTDPRRLFEKVFSKQAAEKLNRELTDGVEHNEALRNKMLTHLRDEYKKLNIKAGSKESAATQKYIEKHYIDEYGDYRKYDDIDLRNEFPNIDDQERIKKAAKWLSNFYQTAGIAYNDRLTENGYKPMELRKNYAPHFQEKGDVLSKIGYPLSPQTLSEDVLPTDINGLTDEFKPGKKYFSHEQRRTGEKTVYDATRGFDEYIEGWSNVVYHTEDIQKRRAIAKLVRDTWGPTNGTSNENFIGLTKAEQVGRINEIQKHKLSKFAAWLDEQANFIAGKKGKLDRAFENRFGRKLYTIMRAGKKQVGSNMVGFNIRSPLTNFASTIQAFSKTNPVDTMRGYASTIANIFKKDDLIDKSDFLTNRLNQSEKIYNKLWDKASNIGQLFMGATDNVTTNMIYRSKYAECMRKGIGEKEAIRICDDFTSRIMGNHTIGTTASIFNDQMLGMVTQFQLEVNNYWSSLIHDNKMALKDDQVSLSRKLGGMVWQAGTLAGLSYLFNNFMTDLTGSDVMLDFVEMFKTLFAPDDDDEEKTILERSQIVLGDILNQLPFSSIMNGGRLPVGEAFKGFSTGFKFITGQEDKYGNALTLSDVGKDALDSAYYWLLPAGKSQISKAKKGLSMYDSNLPVPGSYTNSDNLRFTAEDTNWGKAKAVLFGQYSQKEAKDYIDSGYKSIDKNKVQEMKDLGMSSSEYRKFREEFKKATSTKDNNKYDIYTDDKGNTYYYDKDKKIVYDTNYKKTNKSILSLNKASENELKFNFIANSNLSESNKQILFKNEFKDNLTDQYGNEKYKDKDGKTYWYDSKTGIIYNSKHKDVSKEIKVSSLTKDTGKDFSDYKDFDSMDEINYKVLHPAKYATIKQIASFEDFKKYESEIADIKDKAKKKSRNARKNDVIRYINSLELNIPQKAMLIRLSYTSFNNYNKQIVNYINKQDLTEDEKTSIFKSIGFEIKKGRVYYK